MVVEKPKREDSSTENGADSVRLILKYDGAGSRISKIRERKSASETEWTTELTTHYTGIGSEIREDAINNATKVVVNLPQGAPSVVLFEKHLFAASSLVLIFSKKAGFSLTKVNKVADSVQHSH